METQNSSHENCCARGGRRGKIIGIVILIIAIGAVLLVALAASNTRLRQGNIAAGAPSQGSAVASAMYPSPYNPGDDAKQFTLPSDATKSGEILMQVANADTAQQNISAVASEHGGTVYATYSAHAPGDGVRNGFMVVQVDESQFDATYAALKSLGTSIIQESTKTVPRNNYAVPMVSPAEEGQATVVTPPVPTNQNVPAPTTAVSNNVQTKDETVAQPEVAIAPILPPIYSASKGYIKVNFIESGRNIAVVGRSNGSAPFFMGYEGMGLRQNIWLILAIKSIAVIILLFILFILVARFANHMKQRRAAKKKTTVHIVRQQPKSRPRVVRIARKK